jgi:hypothetical protein
LRRRFAADAGDSPRFFQLIDIPVFWVSAPGLEPANHVAVLVSQANGANITKLRG